MSIGIGDIVRFGHRQGIVTDLHGYLATVTVEEWTITKVPVSANVNDLTLVMTREQLTMPHAPRRPLLANHSRQGG